MGAWARAAHTWPQCWCKDRAQRCSSEYLPWNVSPVLDSFQFFKKH